MEPLKRSISKLKPPSKITPSSTPSSALATALAVAAAVTNENIGHPDPSIANIMNKGKTTTTPVSGGLKRKAEVTPTDLASNKRTTRALSTATTTTATTPTTNTSNILRPNHSSTRTNVPTTTITALVQGRAVSNTKPPAVAAPKANASRAVNARPNTPKPANAPIQKKPLSTVSSTSAATTSTSRMTRGRIVSTITTTNSSRPGTGRTPVTRGAQQRQQQPSPSPSVSSTISEPRGAGPKTSAKGGDAAVTTTEAEKGTKTNFMNNTEILNVLAMAKKKKRPAWDTKGRLEDMEALTGTLHELLHTSASNMDELTGKLEMSESKIAQLESFRKNLESKVAVKENENFNILQKMQHVELDLQTTAKQHEDVLRTLRSQHMLELEQLKMTQTRLKRETETLEGKLRSTNSQLDQQAQESVSLKSTISTQSASCLALESDNKALKNKIEMTEDTLKQREETIESLETKLDKTRDFIKNLEHRIRLEETIRRRLHNTIQELKGNIRVFCRVRPGLSSAPNSRLSSKITSARPDQDALATIKYPDQEGREIEFAHSTETARGSQVEKSYGFVFDRVFQPSSTQSEVFEEISQLVQSALDGYNVCIFAYGQTGSGKTYTMEGPLKSTSSTDSKVHGEMGMIPRSVLQIYEHARELESKGWKYKMEGQYVEIYNETIHDLLGNEGSNSSSDLTGGSSSSKKHEIRHGPGGRTTITDITTVVLTSPEKVAALIRKAAHNRSVGSTQMNERSSRSHCVFTLRLSGTNSITDEASEGVLNLIDLAGSERLSQSGATGDRLKETQAINKSLSCLGDVIYAIANKDPHIPYRNSKLTYLLQNSLGGNSKTLMFVNISPLASNFNETLCSLRFATKVNSCTIGTATKRPIRG